MAEHPILFNGEMVRAILDGSKTQNRRPLKPQPTLLGKVWLWHHARMVYALPGQRELATRALGIWKAAPYHVGGLLWVRETWMPSSHDDRDCPGYRADMTYQCGKPIPPDHAPFLWRPSIHMPRWASRITLRVTDVRVQRVQEITEEDAKAEGCGLSSWTDDPDEVWPRTAGFAQLWDSIYGKTFPWSSNCWCWCLSFERVEGEGR